MELLMQHVGKGFLLMLLISMPIVFTAAALGLVIGIIQAVTQIQEQTIAAAPKIIAVFIVLMVMSGFFTGMLKDYIYESARLAFDVIPRQGNFVISKNSIFYNDKNYSGLNKPGYEEMMKNPAKTPFAPHRTKPTYRSTGRVPYVEPNMVETRRMYTGR